jgi:hypothetical protein
VTASPVSLESVKSGARSPSETKVPTSLRRGVSLVRVSRTGNREGKRVALPSEQRERIADACTRHRLKLLEVVGKLGVSGGAPLARRRGLLRAVAIRPSGSSPSTSS